jgi:flagellar biosynthesis protein FlhA
MSLSAAPARAFARSDVAVAGLVAAILIAMLAPLPSFLIDFAVIINLALSVGVLIVAANVRSSIEFSSFPSLLLLTTLMRIGVSIAATRKILLEAHAGSVIDAFGKVVVGGNTVVGIVVFLILIIVQYVVVTNGAGRVSEVAARFTLDAMPGKQMAIDADLNAGLIDADSARARRSAIEREASFFGAMDGASKFIKGDAIAGIFIVIVNIVGGIVIGVLSNGLDLGTALTTYAILTVGEGIVSQIGSLLVSTAMGLLVTRGAEEQSLGAAIGGQLMAWPRIFTAIGVLVAGMGLIPGFPALIFFAAGGSIFLAARAVSAAAERARELPVAAPAVTAAAGESEGSAAAIAVEAAEIEVGAGLAAIVKGQSGTEITARLALIRREIAAEMGFLFPMVRTQDTYDETNGYRIRLRGAVVASGTLYPSRLLALAADGGEPAIDGIPATEPIYGFPAVWITPTERPRAEAAGYIVHEPLTVIVHHLRETMRRHAAEILSRQDVKNLIDGLREKQPAIADELTGPSGLSIGAFQSVLAGLLAEGVSIRDLTTIGESVATAAVSVKEPSYLIEVARRALRRTMTARLVGEDGKLRAMALEASIDARLGAERLRVEGGSIAVALSPAELRALVDTLGAAAKRMGDAGHLPVLLTTAKIRRAIRNTIARPLADVSVLAYEELDPELSTEIVETVRL